MRRPRVPGAMQRAALRGVMLRRTGTPVIFDNASRDKPGSRLCGAPLRKSYALHRVRDTVQVFA
jgi:hypothetical protein